MERSLQEAALAQKQRGDLEEDLSKLRGQLENVKVSIPASQAGLMNSPSDQADSRPLQGRSRQD